MTTAGEGAGAEVVLVDGADTAAGVDADTGGGGALIGTDADIGGGTATVDEGTAAEGVDTAAGGEEIAEAELLAGAMVVTAGGAAGEGATAGGARCTRWQIKAQIRPSTSAVSAA